MTAAVHAGVVGALSLRHDIRLRERDFGALEGKANTHYDAVWASDATTPHAKPHGAETTRDVRDRVLSLISDLERDHAGETFVLVSHGDTAQITETWFKGIAPHAHRSLTPMQTGELRKVT
jgi:probable phosphoglycerate mutase